MQHSPYYDPQALTRETAAGRHREAIGGLWEELGTLQLEFLKSQGLQPEHRMLDIGCGALRLGVKAVDYLHPGHYFGADLSVELMEAGYAKELSEAQRARLPRENLHATAEFDFSFLNPSKCEAVPAVGFGAVTAPSKKIDYAMAQSVFTHLPLNHIRRCLAQLAPHLKPGGVFFATFWLVPEAHPLHLPFTQPGAIDGVPIVTTDIADPYHYQAADLRYAASGLPYAVEILGDWNHPRRQSMVVFRRT